jgi:hypothetical protein
VFCRIASFVRKTAEGEAFFVLIRHNEELDLASASGQKATFALQNRMSALGQKRTTGRIFDVRFTPKSGHRLNLPGCPLCANSGQSALQRKIRSTRRRG